MLSLIARWFAGAALHQRARAGLGCPRVRHGSAAGGG